MSELIIPMISALWLDILTSISPCPLATNIAAISYIGRRVDSPASVLKTGLLYALGRVLTYIIIAFILVKSLLASAPIFVNNLQKYMILVLGPIMILVGLILLGVITFNIKGRGISEKLQRKAESLGVLGGGLLGILFALSFCPTSAALFFGSLIPSALEHNSSIILPSLYGIGTGLPVIFFAVMLAMGTNIVSKVFNKVTAFEIWARRLTGIVFIGIGIYYTLVYTI